VDIAEILSEVNDWCGWTEPVTTLGTITINSQAPPCGDQAPCPHQTDNDSSCQSTEPRPRPPKPGSTTHPFKRKPEELRKNLWQLPLCEV